MTASLHLAPVAVTSTIHIALLHLRSWCCRLVHPGANKRDCLHHRASCARRGAGLVMRNATFTDAQVARVRRRGAAPIQPDVRLADQLSRSRAPWRQSHDPCCCPNAVIGRRPRRHQHRTLHSRHVRDFSPRHDATRRAQARHRCGVVTPPSCVIWLAVGLGTFVQEHERSRSR